MSLGALLKVSGTGVWVGLSRFTPDITVAFIGVPINVLVACGLGAWSSFSIGDPVTPRSKMFNLFIACVIMGAAMTSVTNAMIEHFMDGFQMTPGARAGMGALVSCFSRFIIPAVAERIPTWLDKIPFLRKEKGE